MSKQRRRRFKQTTTLQDRLVSFAKAVRAKAWMLPPGHERQDLLTKARQADVAANLESWINSPGLRPPK